MLRTILNLIGKKVTYLSDHIVLPINNNGFNKYHISNNFTDADI